VAEADAIRAAVDRTRDPAAEVIIEDPPPPEAADTATTTAAPGTVRVVRDDPEHFEAEVRMDRSGWFVLMDQMLPGWRAAVDGRPSRIYRADAVGRALFLPVGTHRVVITYEAPGFVAGAAVSAVAWLGWIALLAWSLAARRVRLTPAAGDICAS
jgi:hypothetical protein